MPTPRTHVLLVCAALCSVVLSFAQPDDEVPLQFARLDLTDGRKLKNVVVKSYDAKSEKLLIVTGGKAMTIPIALVPPPFNQRLKAAPASGGSVSTIVSAPGQQMRMLGSAADQYFMSSAVTEPPQANLTSRAAPVQPVAPIAQAQRQVSVPTDPLLAQASLSQHQVVAQSRAQRHYRYEYQVGSNSISVTALDFEFSAPQPVPGWTGRCCTEGKAFLEYYDSKGRSFQRATSTFEVVTEQKPGEQLKVINFSRKS